MPLNLTPFSHLQNEKLLGICSKSRLVSIYANIFFFHCRNVIATASLIFLYIIFFFLRQCLCGPSQSGTHFVDRVGLRTCQHHNAKLFFFWVSYHFSSSKSKISYCSLDQIKTVFNFFFSFLETGPSCVVQACLQLKVIPFQSPGCWIKIP